MVVCSPAFNIILFIVTIGLLIALIIKRQDAPTNFYLLLAFVCYSGTINANVNSTLSCFPQTVSEGLSVGTVITFYDVDLVIKSLLITSAVFLALTVYTMQSKYDFSTWGARYEI